MILSLFTGVLLALNVFLLNVKKKSLNLTLRISDIHLNFIFAIKGLKSHTVCYVTFSCMLRNPVNLNSLAYYKDWKILLGKKMVSLLCMIIETP